jgi:uncharacterized membrane protein
MPLASGLVHSSNKEHLTVNATVGTTARPGIITLISVWLWAIGLYNVLVGLLTIITKDNASTRELYGSAEPSIILWAGVVELVVGLAIVYTASALGRGSKGARGLISFFMITRIVLTGLAVAAGWGGTNVLLAGIIHILLPFAVLWAMYGNDRADAWFNER